MPLKEGSSKSVVQKNIEHCIDNWKSTGKVSGKKVDEKKAKQMCVAMAYDTARKSAKGKALSSAIKKERSK